MSLVLHQKVYGKVTEIQNDGSLVVSFQGKLLRLQNHSVRKFYVGEKVGMVVTAVKPPKFRLANRAKRSSTISYTV